MLLTLSASKLQSNTLCIGLFRIKVPWDLILWSSRIKAPWSWSFEDQWSKSLRCFDHHIAFWSWGQAWTSCSSHSTSSWCHFLVFVRSIGGICDCFLSYLCFSEPFLEPSNEAFSHDLEYTKPYVASATWAVALVDSKLALAPKIWFFLISDQQWSHQKAPSTQKPPRSHNLP